MPEDMLEYCEELDVEKDRKLR